MHKVYIIEYKIKSSGSLDNMQPHHLNSGVGMARKKEDYYTHTHKIKSQNKY